MKADEAIEILKTWRTAGDKAHEALDMAIEALRNSPTQIGDMISRQSAIDALDDEIIITGVDNAKAVQQYIHRVSMKLHDLPSAQPEPSQVARDIATIIENEKDMRVVLQQPQWIPCNWYRDNESLPEECKSVLVCIVDGNKTFVDVSYRTDYNRWERYGRANVIAWMPLPDPYKEESQ